MPRSSIGVSEGIFSETRYQALGGLLASPVLEDKFALFVVLIPRTRICSVAFLA